MQIHLHQPVCQAVTMLPGVHTVEVTEAPSKFRGGDKLVLFVKDRAEWDAFVAEVDRRWK